MTQHKFTLSALFLAVGEIKHSYNFSIFSVFLIAKTIFLQRAISDLAFIFALQMSLNLTKTFLYLFYFCSRRQTLLFTRAESCEALRRHDPNAVQLIVHTKVASGKAF